MQAKQQIVNGTRMRLGHEGSFVLENARGETVRTFRWEAPSIVVVYRHDNRRIETHASTDELVKEGIPFEVLAETTKEAVKANPVRIGGRGVLRWTNDIRKFAPEYELETEVALEPKKLLGWSVGIQALMALVFVIAGFFAGSKFEPKSDVTVTVLPEDVVKKLLNERPKAPAVRPPAKVRRQAKRPRVVAPRKSRTSNPTQVRSVQPKRAAPKVASNKKAPRGGGQRGSGSRGYGTNERNMNQIGALSVLNNAKRVNGGNGGRGGLNLQAVGTTPGARVGGGGTRGAGGLANSMYGKGLVAAPFGDGTAAPGSGRYGTRGKAGRGAQGAGYGTETIVGSWKGTGSRGMGPAGSGSGSGDGDLSPWGASDGFDDAIITGGLDEQQIKQVIQRNIGQIQYCYELGLQKQPHLTGRVTVGFQIGSNGLVRTAQLRASTVKSSQVENCIVSKVRTWKFPKPEGGVTVAVVYPFNLKRTVGMR